MRFRKRPIVVLAIVVVAAVSVWLWPRGDADPVPILSDKQDIVAPQAQQQVGVDAGTAARDAVSDGSEWADRHAAREDADVVESVTRSFKETSDCLRYHAARRELNAVLSDERLGDLSRETLATLERLDVTSRRQLSVVRQMEALCYGSNEDALALEYIESILKAALSGDADAESCFVISNVSPSRKVSASAEWMNSLMERYVKYAPTFTTNALERGDPYVAANALYRYVASPMFHPSVLDTMEKADPQLTRRMARLAALRALPEQRARLEYGLAEFDKLNILAEADIARADDWARTAYEQEFSDQPPIDLDSQAPCYSSPELAP